MAINKALRVDPDALRAQVGKVQTSVQSIEYQVSLLVQAMGDMTYWRGPAARLHQNDLSKTNEELQSVINRLRRYPEDISKMAGIYEASEVTNQVVVGQLTSDIPLV
jgi:uncharacterized protein YukE